MNVTVPAALPGASSLWRRPITRLLPVVGSLLGLALTGWLVGYLAWQSPDATFLLLLLLPLVAGFTTRRSFVFALMLGYFGAGNVELPAVVARFFFGNPSLWIEYGAPTALTLVTALPFLLYAPRARPWVRVGTYLAALAVLTLPPIGLLAWHNPLLVAGTLYPGAKLTGLLLTAAFFASLTGLQGLGHLRALRLLVPAALLGVSGWALFAGPHANYHVDVTATLDWAAPDMHLPVATQSHAQTLRTRQTVAAIKEISALPWVKAIMLPESAVSPYRPVDELLLLTPSAEAAKRGQALVFGAVIVSQDGNTWRDTIMGAGTLAGPNGQPRVLTESRVPMPVGNWHLGLPGGAPLRMFASDAGEIAGTPVAWSICFEDTIVWPHGYLLTGDPQALVSVANDWALAGTRAAASQRVSAVLLARLAGVPLVRAENL